MGSVGCHGNSSFATVVVHYVQPYTLRGAAFKAEAVVSLNRKLWT